jgi:NADPH:quinone reductase-like Zn-dependent oxidoreductase
MPLAGLTAWRALVSRAAIRPGETVLVLGIGGGVATFALQIARSAGCRVLVTSSSTEKLARAAEMGAAGGVDYTEEGWVAAARELAGARGIDVVVDSVGSTWPDSVDALRPGGRLVVFGGTGGGKVEMLVRPVTRGQVSILGTTMGSPRDFAGLLRSVEQSGWTPVIDSVRPLAEAAAAHAREEAGEHFGKLVLEVA